MNRIGLVWLGCAAPVMTMIIGEDTYVFEICNEYAVSGFSIWSEISAFLKWFVRLWMCVYQSHLVPKMLSMWIWGNAQDDDDVKTVVIRMFSVKARPINIFFSNAPLSSSNRLDLHFEYQVDSKHVGLMQCSFPSARSSSLLTDFKALPHYDKIQSFDLIR